MEDTFLSDIRGSTEAILDSGGDPVTGYVYDEFGNRVVTGETDFLNETTYTGRIYDEETSLYYMNSRYYDSRTGQFISRDSYRGDEYSPWTQNLYTYTSNNPVNYVDPTGHFGIAALTVASMVASAISGGFYGWISAKQNGASWCNTIACIAIGAFIGAATSYISSLAK